MWECIQDCVSLAPLILNKRDLQEENISNPNPYFGLMIARGIIISSKTIIPIPR
jgi:hypothetical protein